MGTPHEQDNDGDEFIDLNAGEDLDNKDLDYGDDPHSSVVPALNDDDDNGSPVVPHARFHEVNESLKLERRERERLEALLQQQQQAAPPQIEQKNEVDILNEKLSEIRKQHREKMYSGEEDEADRLEAEADNIRQEIADIRASSRISQEFTARHEEQQWKQTCEAVVQKYKILADGENQNKEALADVQEFTRLYQARGIPRSEAVQMAADKVCPMYGDYPDQERTQQRNKVNAVKRNIADSQRIPPTARGGMGERGRGSNLDISDMSDEDLAKLPESEKAKLRGDYV